MRLTGHLVGLLKVYMIDLVEQARQEAQANEPFGFTPAPYRPDQALSDLLAILDRCGRSATKPTRISGSRCGWSPASPRARRRKPGRAR
jgi:hypothetical protein